MRSLPSIRLQAFCHRCVVVVGSSPPSWISPRSTFSARVIVQRQHHPTRSFCAVASNEDGNGGHENVSSRRALRAVDLLPSYLADARNVKKYHPTKDPNGALQLGVAESQLLEDLLVPALNIPLDIKSDCIYYQPTQGRSACRESVAFYTQSLLNLGEKKLDVDGFVVGAGCNAVLENLCFCLAESGDAVLIPTPYYAAFEFDLVARINLYVQPVTPTPPGSEETKNRVRRIDPSYYYPSASSLDAAYHKAVEAGHPPKILLLSHPHNPLGICYPKHVLEECINWCRTKKVHLVSDEIYAGSVYKNEQGGFYSVLNLAADRKRPGDSGLGIGPYVHWVYAMSKDFALSGLRVGVAYSENMAIRLPLQKLNDLCQLSSQTQVWVDTTLRKRVDESNVNSPLWTEAFRNENHRRLRNRCDALTACLEECNIRYLPPTSGLFLWVDLSEYLPVEGTDSEREGALYRELVEEFGLLLTPGKSMRHEKPGFFRIVFTAASQQEFELGLQRLRKFASFKRKPTL